MVRCSQAMPWCAQLSSRSHAEWRHSLFYGPVLFRWPRESKSRFNFIRYGDTPEIVHILRTAYDDAMTLQREAVLPIDLLGAWWSVRQSLSDSPIGGTEESLTAHELRERSRFPFAWKVPNMRRSSDIRRPPFDRYSLFAEAFGDDGMTDIYPDVGTDRHRLGLWLIPLSQHSAECLRRAYVGAMRCGFQNPCAYDLIKALVAKRTPYASIRHFLLCNLYSPAAIVQDERRKVRADLKLSGSVIDEPRWDCWLWGDEKTMEVLQRAGQSIQEELDKMWQRRGVV